MTIEHRRQTRRRVLLAAVTFGLSATLAACGGGASSGGSSGTATSPSASAASSSAPAASPSASAMASSGSASHLPGMATYPPITPGPAASGPHDDADVMFATDMVPHHGQAVEMADMILAKTANPGVKALAERIKAAQTPEIVAMSGWLKGWGQTPPDPYAHAAGMTGMAHSGMMSDAQMSRLDQATGTAADKAFLTLMREHHQGAIDMAKTELAKGANPDAKKLAQSISTSQAAEIAEMTAMLGRIG